MKRTNYAVRQRSLLLLAVFTFLICMESSSASSIRYSVEHLQAVYGADLRTFRGMSPGGVLTATTSSTFVRIQNGQRTDTVLTVPGTYRACDDRGISYYVSAAPISLNTLAADGTRTNTGYVPQGTSLSLNGSNRIGTVVGEESPLNFGGGRFGSGGFIYDPVNGGRTVQQLGGAQVAGFDAVNDAGYLVGYGLNSASRGNLFLWRDGESAISLVQTNDGTAKAINEAAQVVGIADSSAFFWDRGSLTRPVSKLVEDPAHPGTFNEAVIFSSADDISEDGLAVGLAEFRSVPGFTRPLHNSRGWIWTESGGLLWLDDLVDPTLGYEITSVINIADNGQLLVRGYLQGNSVQQHFLLTVIPEPGTTGLLLAGVMLCYRRRR